MMSYDGIYEFYKNRIDACRNYGFKSGHEILDVVLRCAGADSMLTSEEYNSIINQADICHIKMMEDNYNEGWKQNS